jgi:hypothetical protein
MLVTTVLFMVSIKMEDGAANGIKLVKKYVFNVNLATIWAIIIHALNFQKTVSQLINKANVQLVKLDIFLTVQQDYVALIQLIHAKNINIAIVKETQSKNTQEDAKKFVFAALMDFT